MTKHVTTVIHVSTFGLDQTPFHAWSTRGPNVVSNYERNRLHISKQSGVLTLTCDCSDAHMHYTKLLSNASSQSVRGPSAGFAEGAKQVHHWNACQSAKKLNPGAATRSKLPATAT